MSLAIEGYASLFGVSDQIGDVVRAGAFRRSLCERGLPPMLVRHEPKLAAGRWLEAFEDSRGLFVRGRIDTASPAGSLAAKLIARGLDGLSIGFRARTARRLGGGGRELVAVDLIEVSLVEAPMLPAARLRATAATTL